MCVCRPSPSVRRTLPTSQRATHSPQRATHSPQRARYTPSPPSATRPHRSMQATKGSQEHACTRIGSVCSIFTVNGVDPLLCLLPTQECPHGLSRHHDLFRIGIAGLPSVIACCFLLRAITTRVLLQSRCCDCQLPHRCLGAAAKMAYIPDAAAPITTCTRKLHSATLQAHDAINCKSPGCPSCGCVILHLHVHIRLHFLLPCL